MNAVSQVIETLLRLNAVKAVKYLAPNHIVRATRKTFRGKIYQGNIEIILTIGHPNYIERDFVRDCKKAGEPFPVKKIQFKLQTSKKKAPKRK